MIILNEHVIMKIYIAEELTPYLGLRLQANQFMDMVEALPDSIIVISFKKVESISRSFAHQYLSRKKESKKKIIEEDVPPLVKKMFEIVANAKKNPSKIQEFKDLAVKKL